MGRLKDTLLDVNYIRYEYPEPTEADLAEAGAEYLASLRPKPVPCDPTEEMPPLKGFGLFSPPILARVVERNAPWLQSAPHTAEEILNTLFPNFDHEGYGDVIYCAVLNNALFDAGYVPIGNIINPVWSFPA